MSRMEKAIDNLSNVALNTEAARGRIEDDDFAIESSALTKAQILQQSAFANTEMALGSLPSKYRWYACW